MFVVNSVEVPVWLLSCRHAAAVLHSELNHVSTCTVESVYYVSMTSKFSDPASGRRQHLRVSEFFAST